MISILIEMEAGREWTHPTENRTYSFVAGNTELSEEILVSPSTAVIPITTPFGKVFIPAVDVKGIVVLNPGVVDTLKEASWISVIS